MKRNEDATDIYQKWKRSLEFLRITTPHATSNAPKLAPRFVECDAIEDAIQT